VDEGKTLYRKLAFRAELARKTNLVKNLCVLCVLCGYILCVFVAKHIRDDSCPFVVILSAIRNVKFDIRNTIYNIRTILSYIVQFNIMLKYKNVKFLHIFCKEVRAF